MAGLTFIGFLTPAQAEDYYYPWPEFDTFANHNQWAYRAVRAPQAHQLGVTGQGIKIAILDDGLASTDPKLRDKVIAYKDFVSGRFVEAEHGTMVASTIASDFNAEVGIGGVAPGVSIMVARVCHYNGCEHNAIRQAVAWAVASGADIISESFTGYTDTYMHAMYRSAIEKGVVVVTSMGNSGCRPYYFERLDYGCLDGKIREDTQGRYPIAGLMAVSATDPDDGRVNTSGWGSGWGPNNDIAAPGFETSAYDSFGPSNGFGGTSASAPLVAGVAALILSIKPDLTPAQVQAVIQASARKPVEIKPKVWDSCAKDEQTGKWSCNNIIDSTLPQQYFTGAGIVDAEAAVRLTREIVSGTLIPASEFTQSGKTLTITWPNGPADLYLNSRLVARDVSTGYQYQGYENQSVAIQIRQNNRSSIPTIAMISDPVDVEQPVVYQLWSRNSSDAGLGSGLAIAFEVVHTPTLRDNIWKKVSPWDLEHPEFAGIFEFDDGEIAPCRGSNSPENIYFICPYVKEKLEVSGRFRLIGKDSRLSPYSEVKTALFTKAKQDFPLEVSYLNSGLPVISWQSQPGASSYKYRWQAEYQYFCTTET
ncbi:MAG: S8 family peptidase, partial [Rhodoluna sp.]